MSNEEDNPNYNDQDWGIQDFIAKMVEDLYIDTKEQLLA